MSVDICASTFAKTVRLQYRPTKRLGVTLEMNLINPGQGGQKILQCRIHCGFESQGRPIISSKSDLITLNMEIM